MNIRQAELRDAQAIADLLKPYAEEGIILARSAEEIAQSITTFLIIEENSELLASVAYHDYGNGLKEIRSLAVKKSLKGKGLGTILVKELTKRLSEDKSTTKIFSLTYSPEFFKKCGFVETSKESFPEKIWKDCQYCKDQDICGETALIFKSLE